MSTKHVVLGLVIERPSYGYQLQQQLTERFGFLDLSDSVVYGVLDRLERDGHIFESGPKSFGRTRRGPARVMYSATDPGATEFRRWMALPCELSVMRENLHVKLVLSEPADCRHLLGQVDRIEQGCLAELRALTRPPLHEIANTTMPWQDVSVALVADARATRLQGTVEWLQRVRAIMERRLEEQRDTAPVRSGP